MLNGTAHPVSKAAMSLFAKLEADAVAATAPLAERMRPRTLEEFAGQQALLGPGKPLRVAIEARRPRLDDPVGTARLRQNHARAPDRPPHALRIRLLQRRAQRHPRNQGRDGRRRTHPPLRAPHHRLHRRSASLQQGPAGRFPAARGSRKHHLHRRDHGKSFLRGHRAAALAHPRLHLAGAHRTGNRRAAAPRAGRSRNTASAREKIEADEDVIDRIATFANGDARAAYNTLEALVRAAAPAADGTARASPRNCFPPRCSANSCSTTSPAKSTTT